MNKKFYFYLAVLFFAVFLLVEFTSIFGSPGWFKIYLLISCAGFLAGGLSSKINNKNEG